MERDAFLHDVRRATASAQLPAAAAPRPIEALDEEDLVASFVRNLTAVDGNVHQMAAIEDVAPLVATIMTAAGVRTFLAWDPDQLPAPGVVEALTDAGLHRIDGTVPDNAAGRHAHQAGYAGVDAGLTGAIAGFALSGSIVLTAGQGRPRMASLIPTLHVALVRRSAITTSVSPWAEAHVGVARDTSNLIFITGPSRTGDIEMKLNLGVHGPRTIHVVLVPDA